MKRSVTAVAVDALIAALLILLGMPAGVMCFPAPAWAQPVLQYHDSGSRSGNYVVPGLTLERAHSTHLDPAFDGRVDGHVYAQPLLFNSGRGELLVVATENNIVEALDAGTGRPVWLRSLGPAVPSAALPCGNIDPLGITGTPVIDTSRRAIYLDAMIASKDRPQHLIFGLSLENGRTLPDFPLNVADALAAQGRRFIASDQNQRGALLVMHDTLYVPYGGNYGDCGKYHGWVVGISLDKGHAVAAWDTRAPGGGIWAVGGVVSDGEALLVATGNTFETGQWGDGEAVIRLGFGLKPIPSARDYFAPSDWSTLDRRDADLGGTAPLPINSKGPAQIKHLVLALGKDGKAYLLNRDNLGGFGGELVAMEVSSHEIITAPALFDTSDRDTLIAFPATSPNCPATASESSIIAIKLSTTPKPALSVAWCAPFDGNGTPIVTTTDGRSDSIVWIVGAEGDNRLHAFAGGNGKALLTRPQPPLGGLRHFAPIVASKGHLYVPADGRIYAFTP